MASFEFPGVSSEDVARNMASFDDLAQRYRSDPEFRAEVDRDPESALRQIGFAIPAGVRVNLVADTDRVMHVVLPSDPNVELGDELLEAVAGGDSVSSGGTFLCFLCSCAPSSVGTVGSLGSV